MTARGAQGPGSDLLVSVAGEGPNSLAGISGTYLLKQRQQGGLVFRLEGLAAQQRQTGNIGRGQKMKNLLPSLLCKRLAVTEIPRLLLETAGAVMAASGDKEDHPAAGAVGNVTGFD